MAPQKPPPRAACAWVWIEDAVYLFGGSGSDGQFFDDVWRFDPSSQEFTLTQRSSRRAGGPSARWGHTAVAFQGKMYIFGGTCPGSAFSELWRFDPGAESRGQDPWTEIMPMRPRFAEEAENGGPGVKPPGRGGHSAVVVQDFMYVFGGNTISDSFGDHWRVNLQDIETGLVDDSLPIRCDRPPYHGVEAATWEEIPVTEGSGTLRVCRGETPS